MLSAWACCLARRVDRVCCILSTWASGPVTGIVPAAVAAAGSGMHAMLCNMDVCGDNMVLFV